MREEFVYQYTSIFFEQHLNLQKDNIWLKIVYANIILDHSIEHYALALSILHSVPKFKLDFMTEFLLYDSTKRLTHYVNNLMYVNPNCVDMMNFIGYRSDIQKFRKMLNTVADEHIEFWENYMINSPKVLQLYTKNLNVAKGDDKVQARWAQLK